jgi:hypothetical protein
MIDVHIGPHPTRTVETLTALQLEQTGPKHARRNPLRPEQKRLQPSLGQIVEPRNHPRPLPVEERPEQGIELNEILTHLGQ